MRVDGLDVNVRDEGSGPPLLLIHGLLVSHIEWERTIERLKTNFRVIAMDLPGCGRSSKPRPTQYAYTLDALASTVAGVLRVLGITRVHVAGHSLGGAVAITLAATRTDLVDRLILVDPLSYPCPVPLKGRVALLPLIGWLIFRFAYRRTVMLDYFRKDVWSEHPGFDVATVDRYYRDFNSKDARNAAHAMLRRCTADRSPILARLLLITAQTLVVWGADDRILPAALCGRMQVDIPNARGVILEACGHAPNEERPEQLVDEIRRHLKP